MEAATSAGQAKVLLRRVIAGAKSFLPRVTAEALEPKIVEQKAQFVASMRQRLCDQHHVALREKRPPKQNNG
ncbi:hypothetical protein A6K76_09395 [Caryophanon latum]|uniref:Uncharacterized protein n=1 Tax=Caryophanon latum TaxID=33977 RepID=A0A1C0YW30_9BACL|nr:hypothetical protein A6K76_09395 [Caryophanon latum]